MQCDVDTRSGVRLLVVLRCEAGMLQFYQCLDDSFDTSQA
jgi:hypothetical protein